MRSKVTQEGFFRNPQKATHPNVRACARDPVRGGARALEARADLGDVEEGHRHVCVLQ